MASGKDCVELVPRESWFTASREQLVLVTGIGSQWEPGGALCTLGVPPEGTLSQCAISTLKDRGSCDHLLYLRKRLYYQLITLREYFPRIGYPRFYLIQGYWRLQGFALMQLS